MSDDITKDDLSGWLLHPVTIWLIQYIKDQRENIKDILGTGATLSGENPLLQTSKFVGQIESLTSLLNVLEEKASHERDGV